MVHIVLFIFTLIETAVLSLGFISTYLSYPSGFMGDTSPTTLEQVIVYRNCFLIILIVLLLSYFIFRYKMYFSEFVHGLKILLYCYLIYLVVYPEQSYWIIAKVVYITYIIFGIYLVIRSYKSLIKNKKQ